MARSAKQRAQSKINGAKNKSRRVRLWNRNGVGPKLRNSDGGYRPTARTGSFGVGFGADMPTFAERANKIMKPMTLNKATGIWEKSKPMPVPPRHGPGNLPAANVFTRGSKQGKNARKQTGRGLGGMLSDYMG